MSIKICLTRKITKFLEANFIGRNALCFNKRFSQQEVCDFV